MTENDGVLSLNVPLLKKVRAQIEEETLGRHQQNTWGTITLKALSALRRKAKRTANAQAANAIGSEDRRYIPVSCPTTGCVAGWTVTMAGGHMLFDEDSLFNYSVGNEVPTVYQDHEVVAHYADMGDGTVQRIGDAAAKELGLSRWQADWLFAGERHKYSILQRTQDWIDHATKEQAKIKKAQAAKRRREQRAAKKAEAAANVKRVVKDPKVHYTPAEEPSFQVVEPVAERVE